MILLNRRDVGWVNTLIASDDLFTKIPGLKVLQDILVNALESHLPMSKFCDQILNTKSMPINFLLDSLPPKSLCQLIIQLHRHTPKEGFDLIIHLTEQLCLNKNTDKLAKNDMVLSSLMLDALKRLNTQIQTSSSNEHDDAFEHLIISRIAELKARITAAPSVDPDKRDGLVHKKPKL